MSCRGMSQRIQDAVAGTLAATESALLDRHAARCARCREELRVSMAMASELRALPAEELPPYFRSRLLAEIEHRSRVVEKAHRAWSVRSLRLAWGTAAVLAVSLVGTILWFQGAREGSQRPKAPTPSFSQAQVSGGLAVDEARMAALRAGIQPVSPLDDSFVSTYDVAICAALSPDLPTGSLRLLVDGRDVTALADVTREYVIFAPEESLGDGPHLVTVELRTAQERIERSWIFYALDGNGTKRLPVTQEGLSSPVGASSAQSL